jgi:hypothetical protein
VGVEVYKSGCTIVVVKGGRCGGRAAGRGEVCRRVMGWGGLDDEHGSSLTSGYQFYAGFTSARNSDEVPVQAPLRQRTADQVAMHERLL